MAAIPPEQIFHDDLVIEQSRYLVTSSREGMSRSLLNLRTE